MRIERPLLTLQHLLEGKLSSENFTRDYLPLVTQLRDATHRDMMISKINIKPCADEDDAWIEMCSRATLWIRQLIKTSRKSSIALKALKQCCQNRDRGLMMLKFDSFDPEYLLVPVGHTLLGKIMIWLRRVILSRCELIETFSLVPRTSRRLPRCSARP
jgi:hypothetical protein